VQDACMKSNLFHYLIVPFLELLLFTTTTRIKNILR
jgi:hypothetical protein